MCADRIMISPSGFDDVQEVLQRLGGQYASGRQLDDQEMLRLSDPAFLSGTELLFLNCGGGGVSELAADPNACRQLRAWVENGGTLYASDWASEVVAAALGDRVEFGARDGRAETLAARVSDPYLASQLNYSFSVTFDMQRLGPRQSLSRRRRGLSHGRTIQRPARHRDHRGESDAWSLPPFTTMPSPAVRTRTSSLHGWQRCRASTACC